MKFVLKTITLAAVAALAACVGGGGGDDPAPATPDAPVTIAMPEGIYGGTSTYPSAFQMLVLENGEFWALYGTDSTPQGFVQGTVQGTPATLTAPDAKDFGAAPATPANVQALTYTRTSQENSLAGHLMTFGSQVSFYGQAMQSTVYNYDQPASLGAITGAWTLAATDGESVLLSVQPSGSFSALEPTSRCVMDGTMLPRPSGKNVFDVNLTFGPACALPGQVALGVAIVYPLSGNRSQLIVAVTNALRTYGLAAGAYRANP